jgi:4-hydroxy-3-polyprenylbenzoate decarboxylase
MSAPKKKIVIGITGASGALYARLLLEKLSGLKEQIEQAGIVFSPAAMKVWQYELDHADFERLPFPRYDIQDFNAPFASGSAGFCTMIICPCSMGTLGRIASGVSTDLLTRAADVILKERKRLIIAIRESPLNLMHIRNMQTLTLAGAIICPASPSFYSRPQTIEQLATTVVDRLLDLAGFQISTFRWNPGK